MKKKLFCILFGLVLLLSLTLIPAIPAVAVTYDTTLLLENKNPSDWTVIADSTYGELDFNSSGPEF